MTSRHLVAKFLTAVAGAIFLALAVTRRLNFDEALALRAGWLDLAGEPSAPAFLMPWTLFAGTVGHLLSDPGAVFVCLRLVAAGGLMYAFVVAMRAAEVSPPGVAAVAWLALANAAFATHAIEFRYDAAVLILLMVAYRMLAAGTSPLALGAIAGVLALHHLKGAFYAVGVGAILLLLSTDRRRDLGRFVAGAGTALATWTLLLLALGLLKRQAESLATFFSLAAVSERAPLMATLGSVLRRDLAWWLLVLVAICRVLMLHRDERTERRDLVALSLAALGIGFWLVHPRAWAYLAALPVPFLLLIVARTFGQGWRNLRWPTIAAASGLALQLASGAAPLFGHLPRAFAASMRAEVEMLRQLRIDATPADRILDPSGVVYFVPPCTEQWYLDTLFADRTAAGEWMRELQFDLPADCTLALDTYRLSALPPNARRALGSGFRRLASGLAVRRDRPLRPQAESVSGSGSVESFW